MSCNFRAEEPAAKVLIFLLIVMGHEDRQGGSNHC